jgi:FAD dependent oxidoreductase TIGR03364
LGLRSRALWRELLDDARVPYLPLGSLHVAYREDEAAVGQEFNEKAEALGYDTSWLSPEDTLALTHSIRSDGLLGALWSNTELIVDPYEVTRVLPSYLSERFGVEFHFNTAVQGIDGSIVEAGGERWTAEYILVAGGDDFQTLYPDCFRDSSLTRCKLQMMRTVVQPSGWSLGPALAFGLSFRHYPTFQVCTSLGALERRIETETPELERWGIHVMVAQGPSGALTIGDSHEYGLAVDIFDKPDVSRLILDYAARYVRAPTFEIAQQWHGVYAKHPSHPFMTLAPADGVRVVTVTCGLGMTLSFGLAETTWKSWGLLK